MTSSGVLARVIGILESAGLPHMLTGSFASSYHGQPRATQDIDLVIDADEARLRALIRGLPAGEYYADEDAALEALRSETQFNLIELATGWKIDLLIRKSRPFSREEFARRTLIQFEGTFLSIVTAEDLIVAKLEWAKIGGSRRQIDDVAAILKIRADDLDTAYIQRWVHAFHLQSEWADAAARLP